MADLVPTEASALAYATLNEEHHDYRREQQDLGEHLLKQWCRHTFRSSAMPASLSCDPRRLALETLRQERAAGTKREAEQRRLAEKRTALAKASG